MRKIKFIEFWCYFLYLSGYKRKYLGWNVWGRTECSGGELSQSEIYALSKWAGTLSQEQISKGAKSALYFSRNYAGRNHWWAADFSTNADQWEKIQFNLNQCETKRANSLSNNDVVYVFESRKGDIYVVTHSSGLNLVSSKDLLCDHIEFIHLNKLNGLPSDLAYAI